MATINELNDAIRTLRNHCEEHSVNGTDCTDCELYELCGKIEGCIFPRAWGLIEENVGDLMVDFVSSYIGFSDFTLICSMGDEYYDGTFYDAVADMHANLETAEGVDWYIEWLESQIENDDMERETLEEAEHVLLKLKELRKKF